MITFVSYIIDINTNHTFKLLIFTLRIDTWK